MWTRLLAWVYLAAAFWRHVLLLRPWRRPRYGLARFHANYGPDGLRPLTPQEREQQHRHARCVDCGLCVAVYEASRATHASAAASPGAPAAIQPPVLAVRYARAAHDAWAVEAEVDALCEDPALAEAERVCPTGVPLRDVACFVARARAFGRRAGPPDRSG